MAIPHAAQNEVIDVRPFGRALAADDSQLLVRTEHLEIFRYALPALAALADCSLLVTILLHRT